MVDDSQQQGSPNQANASTANLRQLRAQLQQLFPAHCIVTGDHELSLYAQDVYEKAKPAGLVFKPDNKQQLAKAVQCATHLGIAVIPRGGGMSYTQGYVPQEHNSLLVDMSALNAIVEINLADMYVTVEAGCSWQQLHQALADSDYRTPYWGTLSGRVATVGGGVSQNAIFWGSGQHGFAADSVLSMEVILADGQMLQTGSASKSNASPFMRHYGPDLTGLFTCDTAALAIKTEITLRLVAKMPEKGSLSFNFKTFQQQASAMSEVARQGLASETCGFDPFLQAQRMQRESLSSDVKSLLGVMKQSKSMLGALKDGAKMALAGRNFSDQHQWSVHFFVEDLTAAGVAARLAKITEIAAKYDAEQIENTIPKVLTAHPFAPVNNMVGPKGERWVPVHALIPHSKAEQAYQLTEAIFTKHQQDIEKHQIGVGYLVSTVSTNVFVLEPVFFWPDELNELHQQAIESDYLAKLPGFAANIEARQAVARIRQELVSAYNEFGAIHMQLGKSYQFKQGVHESNYRLLSQIKQQLDPNNRINPGSLGFHGDE
ncbi:FAD-binding oxidoreductase [Thalassotalea sp. HSM 43]|uniref:FAD-binding oxidoreductase n=1 Tax=Thalassotalea sp. HSM 43 TaxID=2552945 RepID=UPI0010804E5F|nr:FAD-binding oxidoreductase [Thalassotalea sp. HSM 43]QBY04590.1 FAD-binding oxidoreductase [Thalassotalea sp. HSM 43]